MSINDYAEKIDYVPTFVLAFILYFFVIMIGFENREKNEEKKHEKSDIDFYNNYNDKLMHD